MTRGPSVTLIQIYPMTTATSLLQSMAPFLSSIQNLQWMKILSLRCAFQRREELSRCRSTQPLQLVTPPWSSLGLPCLTLFTLIMWFPLVRPSSPVLPEDVGPLTSTAFSLKVDSGYGVLLEASLRATLGTMTLTTLCWR